jgi:hypothetical protein
MTVTSKTTFTFSCDDGRYCRDEHGLRTTITLVIRTKREACQRAKHLGWVIRHFSEAQCPACKRQQRIPDHYPAGYPELGG